MTLGKLEGYTEAKIRKDRRICEIYIHLHKSPVSTRKKHGKERIVQVDFFGRWRGVGSNVNRSGRTRIPSHHPSAASQRKNKRMNSFLKTFLAALLAIVVTNIFLVIFLVNVISSVSLLFGGGSAPTLERGSVLCIDLQQPVVDEPSGSLVSDLDMTSMTVNHKMALLAVINAIDQAAMDDRIDGIYLNVSPFTPLGTATVTEIRNALQRFKTSGKFIYSYSDYYSQKTYYLSSVADEIYLNPQGELIWKGLSSQVMFYKGLLDKLELKPEVFRHGSFKAAVEPFLMDRMSPENRLQTEVLTGTIWGQLLAEIAASRSLDSADLQAYASQLSITNAAAACQLGMVDSLAYRGEVEDRLAEITGQSDEPQFVTLEEYIGQTHGSTASMSKNQIAVVYAEGDLVDGGGGKDHIGGDDLADKLARMRRDDNVKAVVLRINSPGGSALAAEVVWHEMERLRAEKPVIVSMGDMAASGGYYMAAPADVILASPTTITGSIGVFGLLLNASDGLKNKLGITVDGVSTNPSADLGSPFRAVTPAERAYIQQGVEEVYATFVDHVAQGRNLSVPQVDSLAGGRVWSGVSALQNGLIDAYGGLREAILLAADRAGVADDYRVTTPSIPEDRLSMLLDMLMSRVKTSAFEPAFEGELGEAFQQYTRLQRILSRQGVQAILPCDITLE